MISYTGWCAGLAIDEEKNKKNIKKIEEEINEIKKELDAVKQAINQIIDYINKGENNGY